MRDGGYCGFISNPVLHGGGAGAQIHTLDGWEADQLSHVSKYRASVVRQLRRRAVTDTNHEPSPLACEEGRYKAILLYLGGQVLESRAFRTCGERPNWSCYPADHGKRSATRKSGKHGPILPLESWSALVRLLPVAGAWSTPEAERNRCS